MDRTGLDVIQLRASVDITGNGGNKIDSGTTSPTKGPEGDPVNLAAINAACQARYTAKPKQRGNQDVLPYHLKARKTPIPAWSKEEAATRRIESEQRMKLKRAAMSEEEVGAPRRQWATEKRRQRTRIDPEQHTAINAAHRASYRAGHKKTHDAPYWEKVKLQSPGDAQPG